jgi:hypothetical protein
MADWWPFCFRIQNCVSWPVIARKTIACGWMNLTTLFNMLHRFWIWPTFQGHRGQCLKSCGNLAIWWCPIDYVLNWLIYKLQGWCRHGRNVLNQYLGQVQCWLKSGLGWPTAEVFYSTYFSRSQRSELKKLCTLKQVKTKVNMINTWFKCIMGEKKLIIPFLLDYPADCGYYIFTRFLVNITSNFPLSKVPSNAVHILKVRIFSICLQMAYF